MIPCVDFVKSLCTTYSEKPLTESSNYGGKGNNMIESAILWAIFGTIFGGAGLFGILVHYLKRYIDKKLSDEETATKQCRDYKNRRAKIEQELQHAQSRVFAQLFAAIKANHVNIENLELAYAALRAAEDKKDELEQEIIIEYEQKQNRRRY